MLALAPHIEDRIAPRAQVSLDLSAAPVKLPKGGEPLEQLIRALVAQTSALLPRGRGSLMIRSESRDLGAKETERAEISPRSRKNPPKNETEKVKREARDAELKAEIAEIETRLEAGGLKIGITSVLGSQYQQQVNNDEVEIQPAADALRQVLPELAACDVRILLAHATVDETQALARQFPEFSLLVTADGADEPPAQPEAIPNTTTRLVEVGHKGMYVVVAGLYDDPREPLRRAR